MFMFNSTHRRLVQGFADQIADNASTMAEERARARINGRLAAETLAECESLRAKLATAHKTIASVAAMETEHCANIGMRMARVARTWLAGANIPVASRSVRPKHGVAGGVSRPALGSHEAS